jgi:hypothetical protein
VFWKRDFALRTGNQLGTFDNRTMRNCLNQKEKNWQKDGENEAEARFIMSTVSQVLSE